MKSNAFFDTAAPLYGVNKLAVNIIKPAHIDDTFTKANKQLGLSESHDPIPWCRPPEASLINPAFVDMTGVQSGRLKVLGLEATPRKSKPPRWVCRCVCGTYVLRRTKALKPAHHCIESFACTDCINLARIKRNDYVRRTGKEADAEDFL